MGSDCHQQKVCTRVEQGIFTVQMNLLFPLGTLKAKSTRVTGSHITTINNFRIIQTSIQPLLSFPMILRQTNTSYEFHSSALCQCLPSDPNQILMEYRLPRETPFPQTLCNHRCSTFFDTDARQPHKKPRHPTLEPLAPSRRHRLNRSWFGYGYITI
jgi:hypothetical protein